MPEVVNPVEGKKEAIKFAALEFAYWSAMSVGSFLTVFLQGIGFSASMVGVVNALNSAVGIVSGPVWGMLSDKMQSIKRTMITCLICAMALQLFIPVSSDYTVFGVPLIIIYLPFFAFFNSPTMVLLDSWAIQSSYKFGFTYSFVRSMGSLAWAIAGVLVSMVLGRFAGGVRYTFYVAALIMVPVVLIALKTSNASTSTGTRTISFKEMNVGELFKSFYFVSYLVYTFIVNIAFMAGFAFYAYLLKDIGAETSQVGYVLGFGTVIQFLVILFVKPLQDRYPLHVLIMAGNVFSAIQYLLFGVATDNLGMMIIYSAFHGLGGGLMIASGARYVFTLAPNHLKATAQTVCAAATSIAGIIGNIVGGIVIDRIGSRSFYTIVSGWIFVAVTLLALSFLYGRKVLKIRIPENN